MNDFKKAVNDGKSQREREQAERMSKVIDVDTFVLLKREWLKQIYVVLGDARKALEDSGGQLRSVETGTELLISIASTQRGADLKVSFDRTGMAYCESGYIKSEIGNMSDPGSVQTFKTKLIAKVKEIS